MQCAVIDIGSNSIRLSVYDAEKTNFKILFKEKIMAGLASYVEDGVLSPEGIECACHSLVEFEGTAAPFKYSKCFRFCNCFPSQHKQYPGRAPKNLFHNRLLSRSDFW